MLPDYTVVHKQDWFTEERYKAKPGEDASFLSRSFERHFNERPYLHHSCYLFITKTTKERMRSQSDFSTLCRSRIVPQEIGDPQAMERFVEAVSQAESILRESGLLRLRRLGTEEIIGTPERPGLLSQYFTLSREPVANEDIRLDPGRMTVGDKILCLHTLTDLDDLPQQVSTDARYERLSTDRSDCRLSFAAPVGLLLGCNHLYNQYVFLDNHEQTLRSFERLARNMNSLSRYSRSNAVNKEWIDLSMEKDRAAVASSQAFFTLWLEQQRIALEQQGVENVDDHIEALLRNQCVELCERVYAARTE